MKKVAVILSGCGVFDGAEIHESVLSLLALEQNGASWHCFAPDVKQHHVINHKAGEESVESRNVLEESARIARGNIAPLAELDPSAFDALLIPGGFGVAKNLCDFAVKGAEMTVDPEVKTVCQAFANQGKPAGYVCIAPVMIPAVYGEGATATLGTDPETAAAFSAMGGKHVDCSVEDIVYDEQRKLLSTPAYMLAGSISEASVGINKLVSKLVGIA
ncbi:isoprenoid biosynthesis glyoxalase ElbB [Veronia pacifica]|uniref:Glyoxalase n=1 Tax=Veronia pacifica TaxID=1080227 RepID=A0A1C3EJS6_9GAMM|nr:isoprenoid biosynthesis glyoxalase ElbB [Veronia pacifica]ODA33480.1 isoprenoid biosynthesis protein ElbB [Veronia pacifica]